MDAGAMEDFYIQKVGIYHSIIRLLLSIVGIALVMPCRLRKLVVHCAFAERNCHTVPIQVPKAGLF